MEVTPYVPTPSLEVFVLAFIKAGLTSPYDFLAKLGMGVGSSSAILKRLAAIGYLKSEAGPRNRTSYSLTPLGDGRLKKLCDGTESPVVWEPHRDLRRRLFLVWLFGGRLKSVRFLTDEQHSFSEQAIAIEADAKSKFSALSRLKNKTEDLLQADQYMVDVFNWFGTELRAAGCRQNLEFVSKVKDLIDSLPDPPSLQDLNRK